MKRMKRAYASRIACGQAMLEELQRKFPKTQFALVYFDPDSWDRYSQAGMQAMIAHRLKYRYNEGDLRKCVRLVWTDGAAKKAVSKIAEKYERESRMMLDGEYRCVPNVGFDEEGNPVQMGMFKEIFLERSISDEICTQLESLQLVDEIHMPSKS